MTDSDIFNRAEAAKATLGDEGFRLVMADLRGEQVRAFLDSAPDDQAAREEAHRMNLALERIEQRLRSYVADLKSHQKNKDRDRGND